ncbi:MAG: hypothetical protein WCK02_16425, partial [Bacteroidota bacterium]
SLEITHPEAEPRGILLIKQKLQRFLTSFEMTINMLCQGERGLSVALPPTPPSLLFSPQLIVIPTAGDALSVSRNGGILYYFFGQQ